MIHKTGGYVNSFEPVLLDGKQLSLWMENSSLYGKQLSLWETSLFVDGKQLSMWETALNVDLKNSSLFIWETDLYSYGK